MMCTIYLVENQVITKILTWIFISTSKIYQNFESKTYLGPKNCFNILCCTCNKFYFSINLKRRGYSNKFFKQNFV